ncbi:hypothetical protein RA086_09520 [Lactiplantibacillus sp. WILCCON 0030]|uniref:DUF1772 domain-containing protein n=1 Tax=Lactiplantibacillus brownii TaxID=3069269 RepID=A0ABU1AAG0_9LACO|nr:hypothetical protein [Lactiplantibacillus brownii]MDQ7937846.1 hypothetical protein [Lactiplantibacillus brownii]
MVGLIVIAIILGIVLALVAVLGLNKNPLFEVVTGADVTATKRLFNFAPVVHFKLWQRTLILIAGIAVVGCIIVALIAFKQSATRLFASSFDLGFLIYLLVFQQLLPYYCYRFWQQSPEPRSPFQLADSATATRHFNERWLRSFGLVLIAGGATSFFFL